MPDPSQQPLTLLQGPTADASDGMSAGERRVDARYAFTAAAEVVHLRSQTRIAGRSSDLSRKGCYIDTLSPFEEGAVVRVRLQREVQEFEAIAIVAYSGAPMGMGLMFTDIRPEHQEVLNGWVAQLSGKETPIPEGLSTSFDGSTYAAVENARKLLKELINLLARKKILSENEAAALLRQISP